MQILNQKVIYNQYPDIEEHPDREGLLLTILHKISRYYDNYGHPRRQTYSYALIKDKSTNELVLLELNASWGPHRLELIEED